MSFKGWLNSWGLSWGADDAPVGAMRGTAAFVVSGSAQASAIAWAQGDALIGFDATGTLSNGVVTPVDMAGAAGMSFTAHGVLADAPKESAGGGLLGGMVRAYRKLLAPTKQPEPAATVPTEPLRPVSASQTADTVYKQNEPVSLVDTAQAATDFVSKLLANLPALPPEDDSTSPASDVSAPRGVTLPTEKQHGTQTLETIQTQQEQQAQKAALLKRQDDETALIMILLELA